MIVVVGTDGILGTNERNEWTTRNMIVVVGTDGILG